MDDQTPTQRSHIPALDGLRGIAISLVLVLHFSRIPLVTLWDRRLSRVTEAGWIGVDLFFVLSGFLITGILLDAKGKAAYFRSFYARRTLRIFPIYYGVLLAALVVAPRLLGRGAPESAGEQASYWLYAVNWWIGAHASWGAVRPWFAHFWSLGVEEQFYLLWPAVVLLCTRRTLSVLCLTSLGACLALRIAARAVGMSPDTVYVLTPFRLDTLLAGAWLAVAARGDAVPSARAGRRVLAGGMLALATLFVVRRGLFYHDVLVGTIGYSFLAATFAALVHVAVTSSEGSAVRRIAEWRPLRVLGKYSYGVYVYHLAVHFVLRRIVEAPVLRAFPGSRIVPMLGLVVLYSATTLTVAVASWTVIEQPLLALKRHFPYGASGAADGGAATLGAQGVADA